MIALLILVFFAICGIYILSLFNISINDFMIEGILLFILAIVGLLGREETRWINSEDVAVVPLATPLMAGPGSIYTVIYLMQAPLWANNSIYGDDWQCGSVVGTPCVF
jgi:multiple antibiotic resistance protein